MTVCACACVCGKKPVEQVDRRGWVGFCCHRYFQAHARCHLFPRECVPALQSTFEIRCAVTRSERIEIFPPIIKLRRSHPTPALSQPYAHFLVQEQPRSGEVTEEKAGRAKVDKWWETPREPVAYRYKSLYRGTEEGRRNQQPPLKPVTSRTASYKQISLSAGSPVWLILAVFQ